MYYVNGTLITWTWVNQTLGELLGFWNGQCQRTPTRVIKLKTKSSPSQGIGTYLDGPLLCTLEAQQGILGGSVSPWQGKCRMYYGSMLRARRPELTMKKRKHKWSGKCQGLLMLLIIFLSYIVLCRIEWSLEGRLLYFVTRSTEEVITTHMAPLILHLLSRALSSIGFSPSSFQNMYLSKER